MNIGEIIKNKKVSIFFEDTGMKNNVIDINNENPNIGIFFENMGIYDEEIVVISQKENKEKINCFHHQEHIDPESVRTGCIIPDSDHPGTDAELLPP